MKTRWKNLEETDNETKKYCAMIGKKRELYSYKQKVKEQKESIAAAKRTIVSLSSMKTLPEVKSIIVHKPQSAQLPTFSVVRLTTAT